MKSIAPDLRAEFYLNEDMEDLIPFAVKVWEALPLSSRTWGGRDLAEHLETADAKLCALCFELKSVGERPNGRKLLPPEELEFLRKLEGREEWEPDPHGGKTYDELFFDSMQEFVDSMGVDFDFSEDGGPSRDVVLERMSNNRRELEAVPGLCEALKVHADLLPAVEQRSYLRALLTVRPGRGAGES